MALELIFGQLGENHYQLALPIFDSCLSSIITIITKTLYYLNEVIFRSYILN